MKFDLGLFKFELSGPEPVIPALFTVLSTADTAEAISAGPTMAKNKPQSHRRSFTVGLSFPKEGEAKDKAIERTMGEVLKRSQAKTRKEEDRSTPAGPAKFAEISHKHGQTALRSFVYIGFTTNWIITAMHSGLDIKTNEQAMRAQIESFVKSLTTST